MAIRFANRMDNMKASEIRELLKLTEKPEVISFAGGLPAPELFPIEEMKNISKLVLDEDGQQALQYSPTEGYVALRKEIADRMNNKFNTKIDESNVLITGGSQQGLDFSGKIFLNEGDIVLCESPSYLGAINAFKAYGAKFVEIPTDDNGMIMEELEKALIKYDNVKMIYVIPDFQNPTGRTWSLERRKKFMEVINRFEIPVIEDNPYGELKYSGDLSVSLKAMDEKGLIIFLGSFSKIFCPGLRIGWVAADQDILERYIVIKQSADLQASSMAQREITKFIQTYDLDAHVEKIKDVYRRRRDLMLNTMDEFFPEGLKYTYPEGGLFTWVELPEHINARDVLIKCLEKNVAFVPGGSFFPNGGKENTFRLNYSNMTDERIVDGIKKLASVLKEFLVKEVI